LQPAQGTFTNKIRERERKEDLLKDEYELRADLNLKWEEQKKNERETVLCRSIKY
jgi:hypothetical protein